MIFCTYAAKRKEEADIVSLFVLTVKGFIWS